MPKAALTGALLAAALALSGSVAAVERPPARLVSMSPALTEILFALGLGERVAGVTRYCDFPAEAATKARIGGYLDPSFEAIVALEPDLVLLQVEHAEVQSRLAGLGLPTLVVDLRRVQDIPAGVESVAARCGVSERGAALAAAIRADLERVSLRTRDLPRPRVLVVVERELGVGTVTRLWAAGPGSFYDQVLQLAHAENALAESALPYPEVSREGLIHLDPDVVVDVVSELGARGATLEAARLDWRSLRELRAVREGRVVLLDQDFMIVPGPRIAAVVESVARAVHPGLE
jgi:iron complex transport system substrate-binding protein